MIFPRKRKMPQIPVGDVIIYPGDSVHVAIAGSMSRNREAEEVMRNWYLQAGVKDMFVSWIEGTPGFPPRVVSVIRGRGR